MYTMEIYNSDVLPCIYLFQEAKDDSGLLVCPLCDKGFQTQHQLTMHIRQVTCTPNSFVQYTVAYLLISYSLYASQQRWKKDKYHLSKYFQNMLRQTTLESQSRQYIEELGLQCQLADPNFLFPAQHRQWECGPLLQYLREVSELGQLSGSSHASAQWRETLQMQCVSSDFHYQWQHAQVSLGFQTKLFAFCCQEPRCVPKVEDFPKLILL